MTDIAEFLTARWDEIELTGQAAEKGYPAPWKVWPAAPHEPYADVTAYVRSADDMMVTGQVENLVTAHVAIHDPAYVLADIAAKRQIFALHVEDKGYCVEDEMYSQRDPWPCKTVRLLAAPFAGHPDFDPAWVVT